MFDSGTLLANYKILYDKYSRKEKLLTLSYLSTWHITITTVKLALTQQQKWTGKTLYPGSALNSSSSVM